MYSDCRYKKIDGKAAKRAIALLAVACLLVGCQSDSDKKRNALEEAKGASSADSHVDFGKLRDINEDIFAWINIPDTNIDYPVVQSSLGDDYYYIDHNVFKEEDPKGAIYTEAANLTNMCDFNEVLHGLRGHHLRAASHLHLWRDSDFPREDRLQLPMRRAHREDNGRDSFI